MVPEFWKLFATALGTRTRVVTADLRGVGQEGDDANAEPYNGAEVVFPLGFASRPVIRATTEAVALRVGDEVVVIAVLDKGLENFSTVPALAPGEARLFSPANPSRMVRCNENGVLELRGSAFADKKIAKVSDPVNVGFLSGTTPAGPVSFVFTPQNADGTVPPPGPPPFTVAINAVISNAGGAPDVKA